MKIIINYMLFLKNYFMIMVMDMDMDMDKN